MSEQEWKTSTDPAAMLRYVSGKAESIPEAIDMARRGVSRPPIATPEQLAHLDRAFLFLLDMNTAALMGSTLSRSTAELAAVLIRYVVGNPWKQSREIL